MCDMHRREPESISFSDAKKILDFLASNKFLVVYLTGGEPTLHPDVVEIVRYAVNLGLITTMTTNGTVNKRTLMALKDAGLYLLSVSLDHWDPLVCEKLRRHKDIMAKQIETLQYVKEIGLRTYALAFLNPILIEDGVEKLIDYVNEVLNVPFGFCYPTKSDVNTYNLGSTLSQEASSINLRKCIETIYTLKKKGRDIANLFTYIEDVKNFLEKKNPNFYCKGGEDVVYIDWLGDVYPCFQKGQLFNIFNVEDVSFLKNVKCNDCFINCFREPSFLTQMFSPLHLFAKEIYRSFPTRNIYK
jgi:MoaA/NifB/PqqE/SkfB family radical SAM enzyme